MSSVEFNEWRAYDRMDPIGDDRLDFGFASVVAAIFNSKRTKSSDKVFTPQDFLPDYYKTKAEQAREVRKNVSAFVAQYPDKE